MAGIHKTTDEYEIMTDTRSKELTEVLEKLSQLVAFDTQNPPRNINAEGGIIGYLKEQLPGFEFKLYDAGNACMGLLATRGKTDRLFNFHIDTVPIAPNWTREPHQLTIESDKAYGLGACDIKGASACMLVAAQHTSEPLALLFSTDEEHGSSAAVKYFLTENHDYKEVLVSEPTEAKAVLAHRGIQSANIQFTGVSGHGSAERAIQDNAIHKASKWLAKTLDWIVDLDASFQNLKSVPFNAGKIEGGIKANMIAADCSLSFGFRPLPGMNSSHMLESMAEIALSVTKDEQLFSLTPAFFGPTLPAASQDFARAITRAEQLAEDCAIEVGDAVSFWTEASLFSDADMTALVYGPGNIEQAHTPDEWVALEQLDSVVQKYINIITQ